MSRAQLARLRRAWRALLRHRARRGIRRNTTRSGSPLAAASLLDDEDAER